MTKCAVFVSGHIRDQEKVAAYKIVAGPVMQKHGAAVPPHSHNVSEVIAGEASPSFLLKFEFSDKSDAIAAFSDPDYRAVIAARDEGFGDLSIVMVE